MWRSAPRVRAGRAGLLGHSAIRPSEPWFRPRSDKAPARQKEANMTGLDSSDVPRDAVQIRPARSSKRGVSVSVSVPVSRATRWFDRPIIMIAINPVASSEFRARTEQRRAVIARRENHLSDFALIRLPRNLIPLFLDRAECLASGFPAHVSQSVSVLSIRVSAGSCQVPYRQPPRPAAAHLAGTTLAASFSLMREKILPLLGQ